MRAPYRAVCAGALALLLLATPSTAQDLPTFERRLDAVPVLDADGVPYAYPLLGGFVAPRPQRIDLDGDGDADLALLDDLQRSILYFEYVGPEAAGDPSGLVWRTDAFAGIDPGVWFHFADLDGDGDPDLLTQGASSAEVRYYRHDGPAAAPTFTLLADPLLATSGLPVFAEGTSIPSTADLDGDGDLDYVAGRADFGTILYYRHDGLDPDSRPRFTLTSETFADLVIYEADPACPQGRVSGWGLEGLQVGRLEGSTDEGMDGWMDGGVATLSASPAPRLPDSPAPRLSPTSRHGQNALTFTDLDADGDPDLFWGDFFTPSLLYFRNDGPVAAPILTPVSSVFPLDEPLTSGGFTVASFADADGDGDLDLTAGIVGGFCSTPDNLVENLYYYENVGSATAAQFTRRTSRLLAGLDVGRRSQAAFADLDGDGDLDLVTGSDINPGQTPARAALRRFENVGTIQAPIYQEAESDWLGLHLGASQSSYTPAFVDLDGDGDLDLVVGEFSRRLYAFRNDGPASNPTFVLSDTLAAGSALGQRPSIAFGDLDGDGDPDLLVGSEDGPVTVFRNDGTPTVFAFTAAEPIPVTRPNSAPTPADLDGDGDLDLFVGSLGGGFTYYTNPTATASEPPPLATASVNVYPNPSRGPVALSVPTGTRSLTIYDLLGRVVRQWTWDGAAPARVAWDGRTGAQAVVPAGTYVLHARLATGRTVTAKLVRLR